MKAILVFLAMLAFIGLLAMALIPLSLPPLMNWHAVACMRNADPSLVCAASAWVLSYWWLAMFPLIVIGSFLATSVVLDWAASNGE